MKNRPLAVIVISVVYIVMGAVGFAYHAGDFRLRPVEADLVLVETVRLLAVVAGVYILRAQNWARWLALAWMAFHVVLSVVHSWVQVLVHAAFLAAMAYFLFRPGVNEYFRGGRPEASWRPLCVRSEDQRRCDKGVARRRRVRSTEKRELAAPGI